MHETRAWLFVANWKQNAVTTAAVKGFKAASPHSSSISIDVTKE